MAFYHDNKKETKTWGIPKKEKKNRKENERKNKIWRKSRKFLVQEDTKNSNSMYYK